MRMAVSALLVGASLLASAPASAAGFIEYTIKATGTYSGLFTRGDVGSQITTPFSREGDGTFVFIAPESALNGSGFSTNPNGSPDLRSEGVGVTGTGLTFQASPPRLDRFSSGVTATITLCGSFTTLPGAGAISFDPSCSSASSHIYSANPLTSIGTISNFTGTIVSATAVLKSGDPAGFGLIVVPDIPEPSTWAMMLLGFGMLGAALRVRRHALAQA